MTRAATRWTCVVLAGLAIRAGAARPPPEDLAPPRPLTLRLTDPYLMLELEGDETRTRLPGSRETRDVTEDWTPSIGFGLEGSVYHPRLLQFNGDFELGLTQGKRRRDRGDAGVVEDDREFSVQRYNASLLFLRAKPYSLTVFGRRDVEQRDYDQFNRFDVDRDTYGARLRHVSTRLNWDLRVARTTEDVTNTDRPTHDDETLLTLDASYRRASDDRTSLRYSNRDFAREEAGLAGYDGVQQTLYVLDEAAFAGPAARLLSSLNLTDLNESHADSRSLTLREDYRRQPRPALGQGATYQYDRREAADVTTDQHEGEVYVEHRLFESLESRLDVQVEHSETREPGASDTSLRYGPGWGEHYAKRLGDAGRLGLDLELRLDRMERDAQGGSLRVLDESLQLTDGRPAVLSQPDVRRDSIVVTDVGGARFYTEGFDYRVVPRGAFTEIQRVFGGAIPNGSVVRVDYTTRGAASDDLYRQEQRIGFELDLYERLLYLHGARRAVLHSSGDALVFQDHREHVLGVKSRWAGLEVGAEQVDYESDALSYEGPSYYAELSWDHDATSLKLHAGRSDLTYRNQDGFLDTRTYTLSYDWHPLTTVSLQVFAGDYREETQEGDRDLVSVEGRMVLVFNRLTLEGSYRFEDEQLQDEDHERRYYLLRIKRAL